MFPTKKVSNDEKTSKPLQGQYELFSEVSNEILNKIKEMINDTKKVLEKMSNGNTSQSMCLVVI